MMFIVTCLDQDRQAEDFVFQSATLEEGLDYISRLVAQGEVLLKVALVDASSLVILPVIAFDGSDIGGAIQQLEDDWKAILAKAAEEVTDNWVDRWIEQCESRIIQQEHLVTRVRYFLDKLEKRPLGECIIDRYRQILAVYESQLERAYRLRQRLQQRRSRW